MINLLPTREKREILAGRTNRLLVRYIILLAIVIVLMVIAFIFVGLYLENTRSANQAKIEQNEANSQQLIAKQKAINEFRTNLQTAKTILDKQVNYSAIILKVASTIPPGVIIDQLTLDRSTLGTPATLTAHAKDEKAVLALKDALNKSSYYSNAYFNNIAKPSDTSSDYPYQVTMTVTPTQELLKDGR